MPASSISAMGGACAFKIESHNHPSFIEPFQGAATGVGGILRDILPWARRPVAVMDSLRFGPIQVRQMASTAELHKNHSVMEGVVSGVASYWQLLRCAQSWRRSEIRALLLGESSGECFALGLVRSDEIFMDGASGEGESSDLRRSKTGRDGIHGADDGERGIQRRV